MDALHGSVLIVDDRPGNRYPIVHALQRAGFEVVEAGTGREALDLAKQNPAVILLDVKLPDILGYEVCRRLKANPLTGHIPVLQLSAAFLNNESRVYALESGADAYLTQPVEPTILIATVRSLVKLNQAQALARISARQWQATFDSLSEGVAVVDVQGNISRANRAMTALLHLSYAEIEGRPLDQLLASLEWQLTPGPSGHAADVVTGSRSFRISLDTVMLDDLHTGSIFVVADTTQQKLAEHAALLNERLAATGRMAHTIAHEINNPLAAITNLLFLLRQNVDSDGAGFLRSAEEEVARVSRISRQILSFHRESAVQVEVNLPDLLEDVLALANREVIENRISVTHRRDDGITIRAFPAQLRQVFSNIIRNAIEASSPGGSLALRVSRCTLRGAPAARITVADRGTGIAPENLNRIFDAFFTTKELKGTGVGLWLSAAIVQEHHGSIQVRSSTRPACSGTVISVLLPANLPIEPHPAA